MTNSSTRTIHLLLYEALFFSLAANSSAVNASTSLYLARLSSVDDRQSLAIVYAEVYSLYFGMTAVINYLVLH